MSQAAVTSASTRLILDLFCVVSAMGIPLPSR